MQHSPIYSQVHKLITWPSVQSGSLLITHRHTLKCSGTAIGSNLEFSIFDFDLQTEGAEDGNMDPFSGTGTVTDSTSLWQAMASKRHLSAV